MVTPRVLPLQRLEVEIGFMFYQTTHWERRWHSMKCLKFFLGFFKGFVNFFQFFGCLLFHFFKGIFHFLFKGHHHFDKVKFKVVFFCFFQVRLLSLPIVCPLGSGVTLLNFTLWRNSCIGAYPSLPSNEASSVFASWSSPCCGCLSIWEFFFTTKAKDKRCYKQL